MRSAGRLGRAAPVVLLLLSACSASDPTGGLSPPGDLSGGRLAPMNGSVAESLEPAVASARSASTLPAVQFLPVVGAPADKVEMLSEALAREARRAGVTIAPSDAPAAPLRLKGYLSALEEGGGTVVIYVWDVVDPAGNRLSRIQGQQRAPGAASAADPWSGVGPEVLGTVAAQTIGELARRGSAG